MKTIILKELTLSNWKGQNRTVNFMPNGNNVIKGRNGSGKTSVNKAYCWLLTGYTDAMNVKNHELFDNTKEIGHDTPEAVVKAIFSIDDMDVKLERHAIASFTRKRGTNEYVKSASDTYKLFIDDIEVNATAYNQFIKDNFGDLDMLPYMIMGEKFANLTISDKAKARKVLESIVGEIKMEDMKGNYSSIKDDVVKYGIDSLTERYKNQLKPLTKFISESQTVMDFKEKELAELRQTNFDEVAEKIKAVSDSIHGIDNEILGQSDAIQPLIEKRAEILKQIHEKTILLGEARERYTKTFNESVADIVADIRNIDARNEQIKKENEFATYTYNENSANLEGCKTHIAILESKRNELLKEKEDVMAMVFQESNCPYCGQPLSADKVDEERSKFNAKKEKSLSLIVAEGKQVRAELDECKAKLAEYEDKKQKGFTVKPYLDKSELIRKKDEILNSFKPFEQTETYMSMVAEIEAMKQSMPDVVVPSCDELKSKKSELMAELEILNRTFGKKDVAQGISKAMDEIHAKMATTGAEIATIEGMIDKVKEYIEERANIVSERINERLKTCRIVMWSRQKDGEIKPDCIIESLDGIKYSTNNNSSRIKAALEIQDMFCKHFDVSLPVFVDEASIFDTENLPAFEAQTTYLYASDEQFKVN